VRFDEDVGKIRHAVIEMRLDPERELDEGSGESALSRLRQHSALSDLPNNLRRLAEQLRGTSGFGPSEGAHKIDRFIAPATADLQDQDDQTASASPHELRVSPLFPPTDFGEPRSISIGASDLGAALAVDRAHQSGIDRDLSTPEKREAVRDDLKIPTVPGGNTFDIHIAEVNVGGNPSTSLAAHPSRSDLERGPSGFQETV
jgi:hypothetical protein